MHQQVMYEYMLKPNHPISHFTHKKWRGEKTHLAFVNTTAILSESHLNRFGAITSARFALVIFVTPATLSGKNNCKKLMTKSKTRRLLAGSSLTSETTRSGSSAPDIHALYMLDGMRGSWSSRSQSLNSEAGTLQSSIPVLLLTPI